MKKTKIEYQRSAKEINSLIQSLYMNRTGFAVMLGVSVHTVNLWCQGKAIPSSLAREKIAQAKSRIKNIA